MDAYCERTGPEFWSEPLNALSNLAFVIAGIVILRTVRHRLPLPGVAYRGLTIFGALVCLVGFGSATYHTLATYWAMWADVIPIMICLVWFLWSVQRHAGGFTAGQTLLGLGLFVVASAAATVLPFPVWFNETNQYFGAFLALMLMTWKFEAGRSQFLRSTVTFGLSMSLRTLDPAICDSWPVGTHFLWHSLNGLAFYFAAEGYALTASAGSDKRSESAT